MERNSSAPNVSTEKTFTYLDDKRSWDIGTAVVTIEFILIVVLNGLIIVLIRRQNRRNRMSFFVMHLAISDFMMGIFFILPSLIDRFVDGWYAGLTMCAIISYLTVMASYGSTFMLVVLSADRLYAVVRPLSATRRGVWYKWTLVVVAWIIAALCAVPEGVFAQLYKIDQEPDKEFCRILYPKSLKSGMFLFNGMINVFIPALLVFACYSWIIVVIWRRNRKGFIVNHATSNIDGNDAKPASKLISKAKIKTIKISFVVTTVFLICWSPFTFTRILVTYRVIPVMGIKPVYFILMALAPLNSVANPIVFFLFNYKMLLKRPAQQSTAQNGTKTETVTHGE